VRNLVYSCIAKNPADRPASAAHLARAAQALRRGDVAQAVAAVPAVVGTGSLTALAGPTAGYTQATRMLPNVGGDSQPAATAPTVTKRRNPWTWPLIALIGILLIVLIGTIIALVSQPGEEPPPSSPPATTQSPSTTPTQSASPTAPATVEITLALLQGKTEDEARQILTDLKMGADITPGNVAPSPDDVGKVYAVNPTGAVEVGKTVFVKIYDQIPAPTQPAPPTASAPTTPPDYVTGEVVTVSWPAYRCPANTSLTAYRVTVTNGSPAGTTLVLPPTTTMKVTLPSEPGTTTVDYLVECGGIPSPKSNPLTLESVLAP
jgi:eukaryotic-like serine/threonine-protein kinase